MGWTDERIALLTKYWQEGRSASQIADALGEGLTRNAVIGKAHRLGLASRPSPLKGTEGATEEAPRTKKRAEPAPAAAKAERKSEAAPPPASPAGPVEAAEAGLSPPVEARTAAPSAPSPPRKSVKAPAKPARVTLLDLTDRICKWPIGHPDEPDFHFCGKPVSPGFPYCGEHCLVAYQSQLQRRDRPAGPPPPFRPNLPRVR